MLNVKHAKTDEQILRCFPIMLQLREHLKQEEFVERVKRQRKSHGYQLVYMLRDKQVAAVAGYRVVEFLAWGRILYIDDFVVDQDWREQGVGDRLLEWLSAKAREELCDQMHLDSAVNRYPSHRLYMSHGMLITAHHFSQELTGD